MVYLFLFGPKKAQVLVLTQLFIRSVSFASFLFTGTSMCLHSKTVLEKSVIAFDGMSTSTGMLHVVGRWEMGIHPLSLERLVDDVISGRFAL